MASESQTDVDLDLYADVEGGEFGHESAYDDQMQQQHQLNEPQINQQDTHHYDEHNASATNDFPEMNGHANTNLSAKSSLNDMLNGKRVSCYVGNLTWWTTDQDLTDTIQSIGITDLVEIKFYENKVNGQSKGFAVVTVGSDSAFRTLMDRLPKKEIHSQAPVVTYFSKHHLSQFEAQARKDTPQEQNFNNRTNGRSLPNVPPGAPIMPGLPLARPPMGGILPRPPNGMMGGPPMLGMQPRPGMPGLQGPPRPQGMMSHQMSASRPGMLPNRHPHGQQPQMQLNGQPGLLRPPMGAPQMQPRMINESLIRQGVPTSVSSQMSGINTQFYGMGQNTSNGMQPMRLPMHGHQPQMHMSQQQQQQHDNFYRQPERPEMFIPQISEEEFQEAMEKNKNVSSSAIERAVIDASRGDYVSAIETLVMAISLIKQSKIANDDRCKILISSLQDTLRGIESKYYGSGSSSSKNQTDRESKRSKSRSRDRSRSRRSRSRDSRDRDSRRDRDKRVRRDRTRSRDRDTRREYYDDSRGYHRSRH